MKFLKSQMNPHFLFNALNNIYSLAQRQSNKTALLVLKLSSMLRFIVYETDNGKIPLQNEVDYIRNFVEFQKIKLEQLPSGLFLRVHKFYIVNRQKVKALYGNQLQLNNTEKTIPIGQSYRDEVRRELFKLN